MVRDRSWTRGATAVSTQRASARAMKCHVGRGPCVRMIVPSASARSIWASVSPGARCASAHLAGLVLLRLHGAEPRDDGGGIGRHRRGETLRAHPARDERIGRGRHQEWIFTSTRTSAGGSGSIVTKVGSPAKRRPRTATRDPAGCGPVNVPARRARLRGVHDDQELVADAGQLAGDDDLSAPRALAVRVHDDDRFVGVEDARPGDQLARRRQREVAEHADGALVLASDAQHRVPRPASRTAPRSAGRPDWSCRRRACRTCRTARSRAASRRARAPGCRGLRCAARAGGPARTSPRAGSDRSRPSRARRGTGSGSPPARRTPARIRSRCTGCRARTAGSPSPPRSAVPSPPRRRGSRPRSAACGRTRDRGRRRSRRGDRRRRGATRSPGSLRRTRRSSPTPGAGPWRRRSGSGGRRRCRGRP